MTIYNEKNGQLMEHALIVLEHTTAYHLIDIKEVLEEELKHWQDILSDDPTNDQASRRSVAVFYLLCDLEVPGYEAP